jgi:hypothetical protein
VVSETRRDGAKSRSGSSASILAVSVLVGLVALAVNGGVLLFLVICAGAFVVLSLVAVYSCAATTRSPAVVVGAEGVIESASVQREHQREIRFED